MNESVNISTRTKESPRFLADTLIFYEKDVFNIAFDFVLDRDGEPVNIGEEDGIRFEFRRDGRLPEVIAVEIPGTDINDNTAVLHFTQELTEKFRKGRYTYRIQYIYASGVVTVAAFGNMIVE